ncbi:toll/interleukin-1 receptor (TIR) domain-containing protein [Artemisia annua]|uniref:Toll/interleukin-1 receptor (TIR) domain-containing protein n=1 Tax=Artemisia annua TaxID=35608 RepID=A0A2U1LI13_ARTAN|nr:toll/interleukin-1 receptor (TIR) domain-containing protein [Artemisia annua]
MSTLDRLKQIPESEIVEKLKISYDGLKKVEKELFLDIACFFRGHLKDNDTMEIFEACGFHPDIGIKVLIQKALITVNSYGRFDMHDLVQEMGHYIVRGEHPNNPEKHSRVWKYKEINNMCLGDTAMENDETEVIYPYYNDHPLLYSKIVSNMKKLRLLIVHKSSPEAPTSLSNELRYIEWNGYRGSRFPESFQPTNLAVLKMVWGLQKELWKGSKHLPHLKVLQLRYMRNLVSTPDFDGLPSLQKLELDHCYKLEEIHPSLGNHKSLKYISVDCSNLKKFPRIDHMKKLEHLHINSKHWNFEIPEIQSDMKNLVKLFLIGYRMQGSNHISKLDFKLSQLTLLVHLDLSDCNWLEKLPEFPRSIVIFVANKCHRLTDVGDSLRNCKWLCQVSLRGGGILNDGDRLLQSMLQGKAIENHSMFLILEGLQIPREFRPRLRDGTRCTVQLPENLCNDYCGFLMCAVIKGEFNKINTEITMKQVRGGSMGIDSQDDEVWKESVDDKRTWVGYVSFGSLRHSVAWLDETRKAVSFSITILSNEEQCRGFGVSLVPRPSGSGPTDTSPPEYYDDNFKKKYDFKPEFKTKDDSRFRLFNEWQNLTRREIGNDRGLYDFKHEFEIEDDSTCTFSIPSGLIL